MSRPYRLVKPCELCPFRNDIRPYLSRARVREIEMGLYSSEFLCHETTGAKSGVKREEAHCAGALILLEKLERPSQMMRIAERLGMYDASKLDMNAPVFDSFHEMAKVQPKRGK